MTLPSLFVSHGAPTFALAPGLHGAQLRALGQRLPRPTAIAVVSAHWQAAEVRVATHAQPATVHDFGGFPAALYQLRYPAPGAPTLARRALALLQAAGWTAREDEARGLDHGAWVPLMHLFPAADIPVFQIAMPRDLDEAGALRLGRDLAPLADEGVLVIGSGSLTHNLYETRFGDATAEPYVHAFADWATEQLQAGRPAALHLDDAPAGRRAHPTPEHFLPLLVAAGAGGLAVEALDGGIEHGVLAMRSFVFA